MKSLLLAAVLLAGSAAAYAAGDCCKAGAKCCPGPCCHSVKAK